MTAETTPPSGDAQKPWGGHPSCDPAPLTTSFGTVGQWERRHRAMVERTKGRRPKNRPCDTKGRRPKNRPAKGGTLEATWGRGEGTREPWRRGATDFCKLSRQLLVGLNEHRWRRTKSTASSTSRWVTPPHDAHRVGLRRFSHHPPTQEQSFRSNDEVEEQCVRSRFRTL